MGECSKMPRVSKMPTLLKTYCKLQICILVVFARSDILGTILSVSTGAQLRGAGGCSSTPQPKKGVPCNSARSDDFFY